MSPAQEQLDQAEAALGRWVAEHAVKTAEGARVRSMTDVDLTEDPAEASVRAAETVLRLATEAEVAANAVTAAEAAVEAAQRGVLRERAGVLRARAGRLRDAAAGVQRQVDRLLDEVERIEGARYQSPSIAGRAIALGTVGGGSRSWAVPRTEIATQALGGLEKLAAELEGLASSATRVQLPGHLRREVPALLPIERDLVEALAGEPVGQKPIVSDSTVLAGV